MNVSALTATTDLSKSIQARAAARKGGSVKAMAEGRSDEFRINPFLIKVEDGFNVRDFESPEVAEHVDDLARSIAAIGVQRALKVRNRGGDLVLKDGECRLRATIRAIEVYGAEIATIPVKLSDRSESDADATLGILVENSGLDITPVGKSVIVKRLLGYGWSHDDIANKAGLSKARVVSLLDLAGLSTEIKGLISAGVISSTHALTIARENDFDDEKTLKVIQDAETKVAATGKVAASGRARVTAKATGGSLKSNLADIFSEADVETAGDGDDATVILTIPAADYAKVKSLLKLV